MRVFAAIEHDIFSQQLSLSPARFRELAQEWARVVAADVGTDAATFSGAADGSYLARLQPYVSSVNQNVGVAHARVMLDELSEAVQAQLAVAAYLHEAVNGNQRHAGARLLSSDDLSSHELIKEPLGLIEYFRQPLTPATATEFVASQSGLFPADRAESFYHDYWSLPVERRAQFMQALLNHPRHGGYKRLLGIIKDHQIIRDFLPPDGGPNSAFRIGQTITGAFAWTAPLDISAEALTSMIGAVREDIHDQQSPKPRAKNEAERFGYRLGSFMNGLGHGAAKVAQYGHSLPTVNDAWMPGLANSKTHAGHDSRYSYLQSVQVSVSDAVKRHIARITAYKGTGAWVETYSVEFNPAYIAANQTYSSVSSQDDLVLSVLKPNARESGLKFIGYLLRLGRMAKATSVEAQKSVGPLLEIVEQGQRMVVQETDLRNSVPQESLSAEYFNKLKVAVGKLRFSFFTQNAFDCDEKFRVSLEVKGPHFNQLPEVTEAQRYYKRQVAIALFVAAANMCLRGKPFNHDIHGDNEGIENKGDAVRIGMFDSGALDVNAPASAQKRMLADCLFNALANTARNHYGPASSLKHTIAKTAEAIGPDRQEELDYANAVLRSFLSIGDYMRHMRKRDFLIAGVAILRAGDLDREFTARFRHRLKALAATTLLPASLSRKYEAEREQRARFYPRNPKPKRARQEQQELPLITEAQKPARAKPPNGWLSVGLKISPA